MPCGRHRLNLYTQSIAVHLGPLHELQILLQNSIESLVIICMQPNEALSRLAFVWVAVFEVLYGFVPLINLFKIPIPKYLPLLNQNVLIDEIEELVELGRSLRVFA